MANFDIATFQRNRVTEKVIAIALAGMKGGTSRRRGEAAREGCGQAV